MTLSTDLSLPVAAWCGDEAVTYPVLRQDIDHVAQWLEGELGHQDIRIAVSFRSIYWHWVSTLAILQLGRTCASLLATPANASALANIFQVWLSDDMPSPEGLRGLRLEVAAIVARRQSPAAPLPSEGPARLSLHMPSSAGRLLFTSGTTGRPRGIVLSANDIVARLRAASLQYGDDVSSATRLVSMMGLDTIGAFLLTLLTWLKGGTLLFRGEGGLSAMLPACNLLSASPARLREIMDASPGLWPGREQRLVRVGGARLYPGLRDEALARIGYRVQTTYGATELGLVASCDATLLDQHPGAAGWVLSRAEVEIVDDHDLPVPFGAAGRVRCRTPGMATGYFGNAESSSFRQGWFYPGDIGTLSADGLLVITGRDVDVLNLGGSKLSALDLEGSLLKLKELKDVCVLAADSAVADTLIVVAVYDDDVDSKTLLQRIRTALALPVPFHLVRMPKLPRNAMGKLPRALIATQIADCLPR